MKIGPRYKIARRVGAPIFEKTQTQKYALSLARKERSERRGRNKPKSEFGRALNEKQKARFTYGLGDKQLRSCVLKALRAADPVQKLFTILESRVDNILFRSGLAKTRAQARQAASHGHIMLNSKRITVPSIELHKGDTVTIRPSSANSPLFADATERMQTLTVPTWLKVDPGERKVTVDGEAVYDLKENLFDLGAVVEFYNR